jgi:hypothetical protein
MTKINLDQLKKEIKELKRHQPLYRLLRDELLLLGFWKFKGRGNPSKGYKAMRNRKTGGENG